MKRLVVTALLSSCERVLAPASGGGGPLGKPSDKQIARDGAVGDVR